MKFINASALISMSLLGVLYPVQSSAQDTYLGEKLFKKCKACHAVGEGAKHRIGPQLNGLGGRKAGTVEGFDYSDGMKAAGENGLVWDKKTLDKFLIEPDAMIEDTAMAFSGLEKAENRTDLIAYLLTLAPPAAKNSGEVAAKKAVVSAPPEFTEAYLSDPAHVATGKELWFGQCTHCHGFKAYPGKAPKLKPENYTPDFVYKRVAKGFKKMPAWEDVFSQDEMKAIVAYVQSNSFSP